ncbi:phospholipase C [Brevundimonas mediterranea]|uniref:phospholipase C n=2 Tax=Brevundimonas mediterranea TaxID=74329 RepID=A0A7W6A365_9CAUL|nr:phospholipase C, phosphocholine-specific [Brevundimonas mediterranea]MBB3871834.1 phospholipase C [Brevundimonas mediterranea]
MSVDRRSLLAGGLAGGLGAALAAGLPASLARALSIPADVRKGTIEDVAHVVILMQENRSFDHYFGAMAGVRGFGDAHPIPVAVGSDGAPRDVWTQTDRTVQPPADISPFHLSTEANFDLMRMEGTPHHWPDAQAAWDQGRMAHWPEAKTQRALGFYRREDIPFQYAMAEAFTLCDAYHCSVQTGTNTNRLFLFSGTNDPHGLAGGPVVDNVDDDLNKPDDGQPRYDWTTYAERLQAAGIDWRHYQNLADNFGDNPVQNFMAYRRAWRDEPGSDPALKDRALSTRDLDQLKADVLGGRLPQVSWIIGTAEGSEHPGPSSPAQGADYMARVIDALTADPAVWARTVLFINFDENDGFFDHVPPPAPPSPDPQAPGGFAGASTVSTAGEYHRLPAPGADGDTAEFRGRPYGLGPRVPMYVLSPWSRGGWVHSEVADHTSVIRFLERRFGVMEPNISAWRRAVCSDLTTAFDFATPNDTDFTRLLPDTTDARLRAAAIPHQPTPVLPADHSRPPQEPGERPARPTRYRLQATCDVNADRSEATLTFSVQGELAAVFHVYDRLHLDRVPRRYTVGAGESLTGVWALAPDGGRYDLWVLGPSGRVGHFVG